MMAPVLAKADGDVLTDRSNRAFVVKGRIKPGVSSKAASGEALALANSLARSFPKTNRGFGAVVRTELATRVFGSGVDYGGDAMLAMLLFSLATVVLLVACASVANLILSRGRTRARELAVRLAIGASHTRLMRTLLAECTLIALGGRLLGLVAAQAGVGLTSGVELTGDIPLTLSIQLDQRALFFTIALSMASVLFFGLAPAIGMTRRDLVPALKAGELDPARQRLFGRNPDSSPVSNGVSFYGRIAQRGWSFVAQSDWLRPDPFRTAQPGLLFFIPASLKETTIPGSANVALSVLHRWIWLSNVYKGRFETWETETEC